MIVDIHVHASPEKVAAKAMGTLEALYGAQAFSDGTIAELLAHMSASGVDQSVILPVSTAARQVISINTWISGLVEEYLSRPETESVAWADNRAPLIGFGTIHPQFEGHKDEIQRMKELGIRGVKFQPTFQEFYPDDERMFPIYEELIKAGLIILFHVGDEIKHAPVVYSTPRRLARMLDAMKSEIDGCSYRSQAEHGSPGTVKIIAAHLGGYRMWDQVEDHLVGRDLYFGTSYVFGHLDTDRALRIIRSHGIDRVLFGSDFPFASQRKDVESVLQLDLARSERQRILGGNAAKLLGLS